MKARAFCVVAAFVAAAVFTPLIAAAAKDDPAKEKADHEALRKELKDKKYFVYFDLSYYVDPAKLKESRWVVKDPPPFADVSEKQGCEFYATLEPPAGGERFVEIRVIKEPHYERKGSMQSNFQHEFKSWGKSVPVSKVKEMAEGFYEDWIRECTEPQKDKSSPTHEKAFPPGPTKYYASAVGIDKEDKKRVRKDWYVWGTSGAGTPCTWVGIVTFSEKFIDQDEIRQKAEDMMKYAIEIKDKRAETPAAVK